MKEHVGDDESEYGVAEELERLVVDDAARRVLVRAGAMRQRVLEQADVVEAMPDASLERAERLADAANFTRGRLVEMARDEIAGGVGLTFRRADGEFSLPAHPHGE